MGLLATIKTRGAATVIWEYDPDGRCENLVRAEQKDLVMLLKESPIPRQNSPANNAVKSKCLSILMLVVCRFKYNTRTRDTVVFPQRCAFLYLFNWLIASSAHYLQRSTFK